MSEDLHLELHLLRRTSHPSIGRYISKISWIISSNLLDIYSMIQSIQDTIIVYSYNYNYRQHCYRLPCVGDY